MARQTQACVVESSAPGCNADTSFWSQAADEVNAAAVRCEAYSYKYPPGSRANGEPCLEGLQCASLWCGGTGVPGPSGSNLPYAAQCGTCAARLSTGAACNAASDLCETGLSCFNGVCRSTGQQGDPCAHWSDCTFPLVCRSTGTCGDVLYQGAACAQSTDCTTDQGCDPQTHVCVPIVYGLPGESCNGDTLRCEHGSCLTSTGQCPDRLADGTPCDPTDSTKVCDTYAVCLGGKCQIADPAICR
jgi:hypothetical protein